MSVLKRTIFLPCPLEQVWHTVTNLEDIAWRSDLKQVKFLSEKRFVEYTTSVCTRLGTNIS